MLRLGVLIVLVTGFLFGQKLYYRRKLSKGLGRKVEDDELTSITAWMDATPDAREEGSTAESRRS